MTSDRNFSQWRPHPWHGLEVGSYPPERVQAYIEISPFDPIKYEVDKATGYLRVDRPQHGSSLPPASYGFIPRTLCGDQVASLCSEAGEGGDEDPLDICVLSGRPINRSEVILNARVVGGLQTIDQGEVDDKIIAVLESDDFFNTAKDISDIPAILIDRLSHYFSTYKIVADNPSPVLVKKIYNAQHAFQVVSAAMKDYLAEFPQD
ncbi:inorganic pyrophosphatase [Candidatus Nitrosoglobus terrae]|uniref:inorganic diphosphatase n=1 Tax=Candidatus Nitrosoglobus terrae TaxID=1630141 RepID=A0A1Q2SNP0_9GAMM|nr:inorganic pyrophosphatase [Candidatus Nitrosoglobus terrae]BAW80717.1 inorganic pyrophosphatase [Candidatus Nitrosoglobus terrae]